MAKTGNTLGKLVAVPVISGLVQDANPAVLAETPKEKKALKNLMQELLDLLCWCEHLTRDHSKTSYQ